MKATYECEICKKKFKDIDECALHEKHCQEVRAAGLKLAKELADFFELTQEQNIQALTCGNGDYFDVSQPIKCIEYDADKKMFIFTAKGEKEKW